ncbi:hypothetical protein OS493_021290 [Desmophyllum pertusum]|uniref:Inosine/uridine-preferring nucleoside hydrolase domain-containing protein n=1 Tax=Desmophyllum pertusum TaxID=174260 RepID=A0A9W9ZBG0_9CNID|nr:hypothetical protein OS493_021290 [Desmophyllum pertusum]
MSLLKSEHAVNALIRLINQHPGEITLVPIGPLTNIALACRLDPNISSKLKDVVIMGGNFEAKGNVSVSAEFNFHFGCRSCSYCIKPAYLSSFHGNMGILP